jgi:hypothetical protein
MECMHHRNRILLFLTNDVTSERQALTTKKQERGWNCFHECVSCHACDLFLVISSWFLSRHDFSICEIRSIEDPWVCQPPKVFAFKFEVSLYRTWRVFPASSVSVSCHLQKHGFSSDYISVEVTFLFQPIVSCLFKDLSRRTKLCQFSSQILYSLVNIVLFSFRSWS